MKRFLFILLIIGMGAILSGCDQLKVAYWSAIAQSATNNGSFAKAEALYNKIVDLQPNVAENYWQRGMLYIAMKESRKVLQDSATLRKLKRNDLADQLEQLLRQIEE